MTAKRKTALTLGTLAGTLALTGAAFAVTPLASGYMADGKHHGEGQCGVKSMDKDADGKLSKAEFAAAHDGKTDEFAAHDLNGDGFITQPEMDQAHAKMREAKKAGDKSAEGKCGAGKCGARKESRRRQVRGGRQVRCRQVWRQPLILRVPRESRGAHRGALFACDEDAR